MLLGYRNVLVTWCVLGIELELWILRVSDGSFFKAVRRSAVPAKEWMKS